MKEGEHAALILNGEEICGDLDARLRYRHFSGLSVVEEIAEVTIPPRRFAIMGLHLRQSIGRGTRLWTTATLVNPGLFADIWR